MKEQLTKNILKSMPLGYALHQFVNDANDVPCDYIFLDLNSKFEEYTGLCASRILGKKITEVIPDIMEDDFDWIKTYAKVAYGGEKIQIEQYVQSLKRWYRVYAYSPQIGCFVTLIDDISEKKILENKILEVQQVAKAAKQNSLNQNKERLRYNNILNKIPVLICEFEKDSALTYVNDEYCKYFGYQRENLIGKLFLGLIPEEEREAAKQHYLRLTPENPVSTNIHHVLKGNEICLMEWQDVAIFDEHEILINYCSIGTDVTERKKLEEQDKNELIRLRSFIENNSAVILFIEPETGKILDANPAAFDFYGYTKDELIGMSSNDINMLGEEKIKELRRGVTEKAQKYHTLPHKLKNGEIRIVDVHSSPINFNSKQFLLSIIFDVTDKEEAMKEIKHLAYHDYLVGVYNRRYFEETFAKLNTEKNYPLAVIMGDINGLKIVNDSFGHNIGDELIKETVKLIKSTIRGDDVLARIGGDEFAILLTKTSEADVLRLTNRLEAELERYVNIVIDENVKVYLSVSFGYHIQNEDVQSLDELMNEADSHVYRRKYYNKHSMRSNMIKSMMSTLFQKSEREENHSQRVSKYCEALAKVLNYDREWINKIRVAGSLHDIGKIGISEMILNKQGKLDNMEWEIMKQHPIKSAEILKETEEYKDIIQVVAAHHERWDGTGYPNGLKGECIPELARAIAVADAYDARVELRSYRKPISKQEAIAELIKCSGTQFDPHIVDVYVNQVLMKDENNDL